MVGGGDDVKVATVDVEAVDNMATLPVGRAHGGGGGGGGGGGERGGERGGASDVIAEKNNVTNKEMELKKVQPKPPKRTSLFIILSFIYAKLLVVICIAYVISEVVTHNLPLNYYEGFFTYLYGTSILFLLYVFCFLLQESTCCAGSEPQPKKTKKEKQKQVKRQEQEAKKQKKEKKSKEKPKEKDKKAAEAAQQQQQQQQQPPPQPPQPPQPPPDTAAQKGSMFQREVYPRKMKDLAKLRQQLEQSGVSLVSGQGVLRNLRSSKDVNLNDGSDSPSQEKLTGSGDRSDDVQLEAGRPLRKRKTSQNVHSHGSFFLRVGAIAFGLGTMIYNGLECGAFFEIPFDSPCYQILRGINPVLQMIFTFMQMYFIFMNSRLNIHRFKVLARFGLMHVVATNLCVWIRTLVLESLKEITALQNTTLSSFEENSSEKLRDSGLIDAGTTTTTTEVTTVWGMARAATKAAAWLTSSTLRTTMTTLETTLSTTLPTTTPTTTTTTTTTTTPTTTTSPTTTTLPTTTSTTTLPTTTTTIPTTTSSALPSTSTSASTLSPLPFPHLYDVPEITRGYEAFNSSFPLGQFGDPLPPAAFLSSFNGTTTSPTTTLEDCGRINIMGTIVQDSAPYLFPFIIEYSFIGAAVIYVMWRHIGRNPRYVTEEDLEHRLEVMLSRRAVAMAQAQQHGRVDCVGASKGLFFGLLLLVGSLICLILFFVLITQATPFKIIAIYLADVSHCILMALSIVAIIIGFIRVQSLKFRAEEQSDLNDILLRVSAFGLFVYAVFCVIAGSLEAFTQIPNLLVMITGLLSVFQVVLQLLFIADVARRRVHLPEHDRSKPGRQIVTFLLICNVTMWVIYTFEVQKVSANPVQLKFYGVLPWAIVQRVTLPLCIFHRFQSAVTLAEIWKTSYKARLE
ncbi:hypothetical protein R5R35_007585 [Gryllus longicercus]|uniref:Proton channel OtopLc n=1 Tax=Gryllus longicercus TaxID=2509291 RepID=A0AAN9VTV1_9ORTH